MQHAQRLVALGDAALHDDPEAEHVAHLREAQVLAAHLVVDRMDRLFAAGDVDAQPGLRERLLDLCLHALDRIAPVAARALHRLRERRIAPRAQMRERELLQFDVDSVQSETVGDWRIDFDRLARDECPLGGFHRVERAHVVQPVGELDEDDAHVARHRQQHLAKRLGLRLFLGRKLQLVELGQSIDQLCGGRAELLDQSRLGDAAVLDRVVHQRGHHCLRVELPLGTQSSDRDRVSDVGLAAGAELAEMRFVGEPVGVADALDVRLGQVVQLVQQRGERRGRRLAGVRLRRAERHLQRGRQVLDSERTQPHAAHFARIRHLPPRLTRQGRLAGALVGSVWQGPG